MSSRKTKAPQAATAGASSPDLTESIALLQYGATLYDEFAAQLTQKTDKARCLQLQRYGDYLQHFGFFAEREQQQQQQQRQRQQRGQANVASLSPPKVDRAGGGGVAEDALWGTPVEAASWVIADVDKQEADAACESYVASRAAAAAASAPSLATKGQSPRGEDETSAAARSSSDASVIARQLTAGFSRPTWRQTQQQCEVRRARAVFLWLCHHLTSIRLHEPPTRAASASGMPDKTAAASDKGRLPAVGGGRGAAARGGKKAGKSTAAAPTVAVDEAAPPPPPPDPLQTALDTRACTPAVAARLYQTMLSACGVEAAVVDGLLKGYSPSETVPWSWNVVTIDGRRYLVDVAATIHHGSLRERPLDNNGMGAADPRSGTTLAGAGGAPTSSPTSQTSTPSKGKEGKRAGKGAAGTAAAEAEAAAREATETEYSLPTVSLTQGPRWAPNPQPSRAASQQTTFYFFANPAHFIYTHLAFDERATLLSAPPSRAAWEVAPRLDERFFTFPVSLCSHPRSCLVSVRTTPFYVTLVNHRPDTTELCAMVYPCSLEDLPERLGTAADPVAPLGPQWVWQQRCEGTGEETFTVMVPQGGYYCLVVGARAIRADPYSCHIAAQDAGFTPIVRYQAKVNFAPIATSLLPRQHLSPSVVRLVSPLSSQLSAGRNAFAVMPTCSNVQGVALVASGEAAAARDTSAVAVRRRLIRFLEFDPLNAVYAGEADLKAGERVEVWVRYAAPDHNGLTLREKVTNAETEKRAAEAAAPPPPPPPPPTTKKVGSRAGGRKAVEAPTGRTEAEEERERLSRRVGIGEVFVPAISRLEVRKIASAEAALVVQPQPTVEEERQATLRRLAGVTEQLYERAAQLATHTAAPVGAFFRNTSGAADTRIA